MENSPDSRWKITLTVLGFAYGEPIGAMNLANAYMVDLGLRRFTPVDLVQWSDEQFDTFIRWLLIAKEGKVPNDLNKIRL